MSAHVLLHLVNELRKEIKCEEPNILSLFCNKFKKNSIKQEHECYILFIIQH